MGEVAPSGAIRFKGARIDGLKPHEIARRGLGYVPENRDDLPHAHRAREPAARHEVRAGAGPLVAATTCSSCSRSCASAPTRPAACCPGGEQQMLTICRTLMGDPDLIMVDEPTEGLAPRLVELVRELLEKIAARGVAILLIEQKLTIALDDLASAVRDGPGAHRVRRHARGAARQRGGAPGMAGSLSDAADIGAIRYAVRRRGGRDHPRQPAGERARPRAAHRDRRGHRRGAARRSGREGDRPHRRRQGCSRAAPTSREFNTPKATGRADAAHRDPRGRGERQAGDRRDRRHLHGRRPRARARLPLPRRRAGRRRSRCRR